MADDLQSSRLYWFGMLCLVYGANLLLMWTHFPPLSAFFSLFFAHALALQLLFDPPLGVLITASGTLGFLLWGGYTWAFVFVQRKGAQQILSLLTTFFLLLAVLNVLLLWLGKLPSPLFYG